MKTKRAFTACGLLLVLQLIIASATGASIYSSRNSDPVYFRQVLCVVPSYNGAVRTSAALTPSSCSPASELNRKNLGIAPNDGSVEGFTSQNVPPDAALTGVPSTTATTEKQASIVLLPGLQNTFGGPRYLLGPAQMTSSSIAHASAHKNQTGQWVVDYTMTKKGAGLWDTVAHADFHQIMGIDFGGMVVSAPIIQPTQSSFSSFSGHGEISGNLSKAEANRLAHAMVPG